MIQARWDFGTWGQFYWTRHDNTTTFPAEAVWQNPLDGFGTGFITWTGISTVWPADMEYDFCFELSENDPHDVGVVSYSSPVSGADLTATEVVTVMIQNFGSTPETGFDVSYIIGAFGTPVVETYTGTINAGETLPFTFATTADLSAYGSYDFTACTDLVDDVTPGNDCLAKTVGNYPPVPNDECTEAVMVGASGYPETVSGTTLGSVISCPGLLDWPAAWYEVTLPYGSNDLTVNFCGSDPLSTVGVVYYFDCLDCAAYELYNDIVWADCGDGYNTPTTTYLTIPGPGTILFPVYVGDDGGNFTAEFDIVEGDYPPPNDNLCDAQPIVLGDPAVAGDNTASTTETWEVAGTCWFSDLSNTAWYSFVAPASGFVTVNTDFVTGNDDTQLTLYEMTAGDCSNPTLLELGCSDDDGAINGLMAVINASGLVDGTTYYVQVDGWDATLGDFLIEIFESPPPPANDDCANAESIAEVVDYPYSTSFATASGLGTCITSPDIWYVYSATGDGYLSVDLCGSSYDTKLSLYDGDCGALNELGCNDDDCGLQSGIYDIPVVSGTDYYIQVGGFSSSVGDGDITVAFFVDPLATIDPVSFDLTLQVDAMASSEISIGNAPGSASLDYDATLDFGATFSNILTEGFEGTIPPTGWTAAGDPWIQDPTPNTGTYSALADWNVFDDGYLISPVFTPTGSTVLVSYYIAPQDDPFYGGNFAVEVTTDGGANWIVIDTYSQNDLGALGVFEQRTADISAYTGSPVQVGFRAFNNLGATGVWIDDISIDESTTISGWLTVDGGLTATGSVPGGGMAMVPVGFDATGLAEGTYTADIIVATNEPDPLDAMNYTIPVTMMVVAPGGYNVSGTVTYANGASSPLYSVVIDIMSGPVKMGTTTTDNNGDFGFAGIYDGSYTFMATTNLPAGGIDVSDINLQNDHILGATLVGLPFIAGDLDVNGTINVLDINEINDEILGINIGWPAPNYVFENPTFVVSGADVTQDFQGLCSGDINGSFTPPPPPILAESFDAGIPGDWTIVDGFTDGETWMGTDGNYSWWSGDLDGTPFAIVDSDFAGSIDMDEELITPEFDGTGFSALTLDFDQYFRLWSTANEICDVDVWDGSAWQNVYTNSATAGAWGAPDHQSIDIIAHANANMKVRFRYYNANYDYWWALDNVQINGTP